VGGEHATLWMGELSGFDSWQEQRLCTPIASRPVLGLIKPHIDRKLGPYTEGEGGWGLKLITSILLLWLIVVPYVHFTMRLHVALLNYPQGRHVFYMFRD